MKLINDFYNELQELITAKELLDSLLVHYDTYKGKLKIPEWDLESLDERIRKYTKFDDGE